MTPYDKKINSSYWDSMEEECANFFDKFLEKYTMINTNQDFDEDARIDISKSILTTIIERCNRGEH